MGIAHTHLDGLNALDALLLLLVPQDDEGTTVLIKDHRHGGESGVTQLQMERERRRRRRISPVRALPFRA